MESNRIKIVSDGTRRGTVVMDAHGNKIQGIVSVTFTVSAKEEPIVTLQLKPESVELVGDVRLNG